MFKSLKRWRLIGAVPVVFAAAMAVALTAGVGTGQAATSFDVFLTPLIGTTTTNEIAQVTYNGAIGYKLHVQNTGDSTTTQTQIRVTSDFATFLDTDSPACVVNPNDGHQLICTPAGGTLRPNDTFDANVRFKAPASATNGSCTTTPPGNCVTTTASIVVAAQSVGGKKNNGTVLKSSDPVLTNLVAGGSKNDTFLRKTESAATGALSVDHLQNFGLTLPGTLFGDPFGVALSIHDEVGTPICGTCLTSRTELTIPLASLVTTFGNPFYNGSHPYSWTMSAKYPAGFQLIGIYHLEDGAASADLIPSCASLTGGGPTADDPFCFDDTITQNRGNKTVSGHGRAFENGNIGFG
jgi:hypothetical protein